MKISITLYENNSDKVFVSPESEFIRNTVIIPVKGAKIDTSLAKVLFGDWDKRDDYFESERIRLRGLDRFEVTFKTEKEIIEKKKLDTFETSQEKEETFKSLKEMNEPKTCAAKTKSGKPCRAKALPDSDFCPLHKTK